MRLSYKQSPGQAVSPFLVLRVELEINPVLGVIRMCLPGAVGRQKALTWAAGHERCHHVPFCASVDALKRWLAGLGAGWGSGGEDRDVQACVYALIDVKARSKCQHSPGRLQYPQPGRSAFPRRGEAADAISAVGCGASPRVSPASQGV